MKFFKRLVIFMLVVCLLCGGAIFWAFKIEPGLLIAQTVSVKLSEQPGASFSIAQFTDTHLGDSYSIEDLEKLVEEVMSHSPDMILFTGDLMDNPGRYSRKEEIAPVLSRLSAPLGKFAVWGNHDLGGGGAQVYPQIMADAGFTLLTNETQWLVLPDGKPVSVTGLGNVTLGWPDISALPAEDGTTLHLTLVHEPDVVAKFPQNKTGLALAGHSHGGQARLPFVGALVSAPHARQYSKGSYTVGQMTVYVDSGVGTTRIAARFCNLPQYSIITVEYS